MCPVFTQDKYKYIDQLPEFCNKTLQIPLPFKDDQSHCTIESFLSANDHGSGWVVKLPYTTNGHAIEFCNSKQKFS